MALPLAKNVFNSQLVRTKISLFGAGLNKAAYRILDARGVRRSLSRIPVSESLNNSCQRSADGGDGSRPAALVALRGSCAKEIR